MGVGLVPKVEQKHCFHFTDEKVEATGRVSKVRPLANIRTQKLIVGY